MAVTQILARISHDRCLACRSDAGELDRLLSLQFTRHEEYIDLNWAPKGLIHAAAKIGEASVVQMLDYLFGGAGDIPRSANGPAEVVPARIRIEGMEDRAVSTREDARA